jgi:hypothetical protein
MDMQDHENEGARPPEFNVPADHTTSESAAPAIEPKDTTPASNERNAKGTRTFKDSRKTTKKRRRFVL